MIARSRLVAVIATVVSVVLLLVLSADVALRGAVETSNAPSGGASTTVSAPTPSPMPAPTTSTPARRTLSILGAGDVLLHPPVWDQAAADAAAVGRSGYDFRATLAGVAPDVAAADVAICHLETPLGPPGGPFSGYPQFSVPPQIATALRQTGFDACSTASNHTLDAGERGVYRTLDTLDAAGVRHAGSYRSAAEQRKPTILNVRGVKVATLSYTFGFNGLHRPAGKAWIANLIDPAAIIAEAARARSAGAEIVVVSLHWGQEYDHRAGPAQISLARRLLAGAGIDLILGSHSHVVQAFEKINNRWVVYGMGNWIAKQAGADLARREGLMPRFTFTELSPGTWTVTKVEAIATWIDLAPRIRIVNLSGAIADPATPAERRSVYLAAYRRITGYVQARGAAPTMAHLR